MLEVLNYVKACSECFVVIYCIGMEQEVRPSDYGKAITVNVTAMSNGIPSHPVQTSLILSMYDFTAYQA